jgi:hypothetical protein
VETPGSEGLAVVPAQSRVVQKGHRGGVDLGGEAGDRDGESDEDDLGAVGQVGGQ